MKTLNNFFRKTLMIVVLYNAHGEYAFISE